MGFLTAIQNGIDYIRKPRVSILHLLAVGTFAALSGAIYFYFTREIPKPPPTVVEKIVEEAPKIAWNHAISIPIALVAGYYAKAHGYLLKKLNNFTSSLYSKVAHSWLGNKILPDWMKPAEDHSQKEVMLREFAEFFVQKGLEDNSDFVASLPPEIDLNTLRALRDRPFAIKYDSTTNSIVVFSINAREGHLPATTSLTNEKTLPKL